jgi:hypothetical protein
MVQQITLTAALDPKDFLEPGWFLPPGHKLATFTTQFRADGQRALPLVMKLRCSAGDRTPMHRYPPYQYKPDFCAHHRHQEVRVASVVEREVVLRFPANYTQQCVPKAERVGDRYWDVRKTLLGSLPVGPHGVCHRSAGGQASWDEGLARKLTGLVSVKGEDLLVQAPSEHLVKYHRLRNSIPARLWKWKEIPGWRWEGEPEHINSLELRATCTTVRWLIQKQRCWNSRFLHLTDSLVVLHALSRGRSSSRRL